MLEQDKCIFLDTSVLIKTRGIENRATAEYIRSGLESRFPGGRFSDITVTRNRSGCFRENCSLPDRIWGTGKPVENLPEYFDITMKISTGNYLETLTVWVPLAWNGRFAGTAGGGTSTGGRSYLTRPDNTNRGWTVPYAVMNGFAAATIDAGNCRSLSDYVLDSKTGVFCRELYDNWRLRSTHDMTRFGKAITELLHDSSVTYSYMNGGSGGGRQSLVEVQNFPGDYDGVWASCPAINWQKFLTAGLWPVAVMNDSGYILSPKKNAFLQECVRESYGGKENYYKLTDISRGDARNYIGRRSPGGRITAEDAELMNEIWAGPHKADGTRLWYGYYPGTINWQRIIPIGAYYYTPFNKRIKPFILGTYHARWITGNPKDNFSKITREEFVRLFELGEKKFGDCQGDDPSLDEFASCGGKLIIDHGTDDPLIPTEGTLDYYRKLQARFGQNELDSFCRLYINPGDNHGNCRGKGPGITQSAGMEALMNWVEKGIAPTRLRKVRIDKKSGELLEEGFAVPYTAGGAE